METRTTIEKSETFTNWRKQHGNAVLVHMFALHDKGAHGWQAGYLVGDKVTTFEITNAGVVMHPPAETLTKPGTSIDPLELDKVTQTIDMAVANALTYRDEYHPNELAQKIICILQQLDGKPVWNITIATITFKTLNVKVDAASGEILSGKMVTLFEWGDKGKK